MLRIAKKYYTHLAAISLSEDLRERLPAWYHLKPDPRPITSRAAKCLLNKHHTSTVANLMRISARLRDNQHQIPHLPSPTCPCTPCIEDRIRGCKNPHGCAAEAIERIKETDPKLNPLVALGDPQIPHDNLSLTEQGTGRGETKRQGEPTKRSYSTRPLPASPT
jgi:hypothetical protein